MNRQSAAASLKAAAGLTETLADDLQRSKLWAGDFQQRLRQIREQLDRAEREGPDLYQS